MVPGDEMLCRSYDADDSALLDGELAPEREAELSEHIDGCARCQAWLEALRRVDADLSALPAPPVANDLRARLQARIDAPPSPTAALQSSIGAATSTAALPGRVAPRRPRRWLGAPAISAAVAAAAAIALYLALSPGEGGVPSDVAPEPPIARAPTSVPEEIAPPQERLEIAETPPPATIPVELAPAIGDLDAEPVEDVAVALELDFMQDLDVIANLELLEALVAMEEGTG